MMLAELDVLPEEQPVVASSPAAPQASSAEPTPAPTRFRFEIIYSSVFFRESRPFP